MENVERPVQMRADAAVEELWRWRMLSARCRCVVQMQRRSMQGCTMAKKFCAHSADAWCRCNGEVGEDVLWRRSSVCTVQMHGADATAK